MLHIEPQHLEVVIVQGFEVVLMQLGVIIDDLAS